MLEVSFYSVSTNPRPLLRLTDLLSLVCTNSWSADACVGRTLGSRTETLSCLQCLWDQTEPAGATAGVPVQVNEPQTCSKGANQLWISSKTPSFIRAFPFWTRERRLSSGGSQQNKRFAKTIFFVTQKTSFFFTVSNISQWKRSWIDISFLCANSCHWID